MTKDLIKNLAKTEMKKRVFIVHGWEGYPEEGWRPWLRENLEKASFSVFNPAMPNAENPTMKAWVKHLTKTVKTPDKNCYLIGHSLGCITILRYLETLRNNEKIGGVILVAGFAKDLTFPGYKGELSSFFKKTIAWEKIKTHCKKFVAIHSDNDPYVSLKNAEIFREELGAKITIEHNMKHFSGDDGITKLPIVLKSILEISN